MNNNLAIGIDLGGTKINIGIVNRYGEIIKNKKVNTPVKNGSISIIDTMINLTKEMLDFIGEKLPIGIGSPGLINWETGIVEACTPNLPDWLHKNIKEIFLSRLGLPVCVDNDANAATFGEYKFGLARDVKNFVLLTLGTGLGSGIMIDGKLIRGKNGMGIGLGHMIISYDGWECNCGQFGCLEAYVSGPALIKTAKNILKKSEEFSILKKISPLKPIDIFNSVRSNDKLGIDILNYFCKNLAIGIINIMNILSPDLILIGGGLSEQDEVLLNPVRYFVKELHPNEIDVSIIKKSFLGENAGLIGAAALAFDYL